MSEQLVFRQSRNLFQQFDLLNRCADLGGTDLTYICTMDGYWAKKMVSDGFASFLYKEPTEYYPRPVGDAPQTKKLPEKIEKTNLAEAVDYVSLLELVMTKEQLEQYDPFEVEAAIEMLSCPDLLSRQKYLATITDAGVYFTTGADSRIKEIYGKLKFSLLRHRE